LDICANEQHFDGIAAFSIDNRADVTLHSRWAQPTSLIQSYAVSYFQTREAQKDHRYFLPPTCLADPCVQREMRSGPGSASACECCARLPTHFDRSACQSRCRHFNGASSTLLRSRAHLRPLPSAPDQSRAI